MNNHECYCVLSYFNGSWIIDALSDIDSSQQQKIVDEYLRHYSQKELDGIVLHVDSGFSLATTP